MITVENEALAVCAVCPNPCRRGIPPGMPKQLESETPSALALLAWYVQAGEVTLTDEVARGLGALEAAQACVPFCVYGFDIPAIIRKVVAEASTS